MTNEQTATPEQTAFAAALSIHYITMGLYIVGFLGMVSTLLPKLIEGGEEHIVGYAILTLLPVLLFAVQLLALKGLKKRQAWGYQASRLLGYLLLLGFPFGTVLGGFLLLQLSKFRLDG